MLQKEDFFKFMEGNFDYLMVVDGEDRIIHMSEILLSECFPSFLSVINKRLPDVLNKSSFMTFGSAIRQVRSNGKGIAVFSPLGEDPVSIPLKAGLLNTEEGEIYLFFGNRLLGLKKQEEWEKDERIKELACIYHVSELIEVTSSIDEFFTRLPRVLGPGMLHPEEITIFSEYQDKEYGQKPSEDNYISVKLWTGSTQKGEIRAGYLNDDFKLLPEEQKMLDEIGRMLNIALERKELKNRLTLKQEEEADYNARLAELKREIAERSDEVEEQKNNLKIVNSYLDRVRGGWEEAKGRLKTIFQAVPGEVVLIDKQHRIVETNRENVEPGKFCYKVFFERDKPCENCRLAKILREKRPLTLTMKQGEKYIHVQAVPVYDQEHEVDGILEFYRDITLEKTLDQQLQQADKLASLGQLVSGIGHEINNPNQFIRGNIKIIKQALEDMLPIVDAYQESHQDLKIARLKYDFFREHIMTLVDDMAHGSDRIKGIVEGLRTFVRKDEGLLVDKVDINTIIQASARLVHNQVNKRADIRLDLAENIPAFNGNSQKIEQVFVNLLVNAGDAMQDDQKGEVVVKTMKDDGFIHIDVSDNGLGMNESTLKQIFDPFFTTKRARGGTGLGLPIVFRIIEEHGGMISVNSKPGEGTTFSIKIPWKKESGEGSEDMN
ncbi:MAG: GHKL domain-containing protein [Candidatus Krumholzibacteriota bacterium]|nr:GHKL domain-containing protein [Candidatus Krumholzibacteriota bacterium]